MPRLVDVALALPLHRTFRYTVGPDAPTDIAAGTRVVVPFRSRREIGIVVGSHDGDPPDSHAPDAHSPRVLKAVHAWPDAEAAIRPALLETCRWMAQHYVAPLGVALRSALPVLLTSATAPAPPGKRQRVVVIERLLDSLMARDDAFRRSPKQRVVYEYLEHVGGRATAASIISTLGVTDGVVASLAARGLVRIEQESVLRDPFAGRSAASTVRHEPTAAQAAAIERIGARSPGQVTLLHGVTGSGKTLVYLDVLRRVLAEPGSSAIVLVPEIALTPQTVARFRAVFGDQVAVLHSALSDGERLDAWRALHRGERRIAVGARSAIFAPLDRVRAIIVDEEHEASYKQGEAPRYHARDVAIVRARHEGAVVVLGSATPSLDTWARVRGGHVDLVALPDRVGGSTLPSVEVVDLRDSRPPATAAEPSERLPSPEQRPSAARDPFRRVLSAPLERALVERVERGEQAILLLNRRGYSSFLQCNACGDVAACPNCSISLTYHRHPDRLACHYCGHSEAPYTECRRCRHATVRQRGLGTQQVERLLGERMPALRIARMDMDTTTGKWAHADILEKVGRGEVDVLLGTQMIAKGLDFPNVTLVGVIDADVGINLPDFRASERAFQLLAQVAGRAGRGVKGGHVVIQTRMPEHHAIQCAVSHDYHAFVAQELEGRTSPPYPPTTRLANVVVSGLDESAVAEAAQGATQWLNRLVRARSLSGLAVVGPAPCPVDRIKERWRWHLLLRSSDGGLLTSVLQYLATRYELPDRHALRLTIDRDPQSLL
ncbi:MAG: primosomal protein N' [Gemmatimonadaceae bacterium]|nr:primosomal protein N' [Gemmatimonadaceae bacterium]